MLSGGSKIITGNNCVCMAWREGGPGEEAMLAASPQYVSPTEYTQRSTLQKAHSWNVHVVHEDPG